VIKVPSFYNVRRLSQLPFHPHPKEGLLSSFLKMSEEGMEFRPAKTGEPQLKAGTKAYVR